ncbi:Belongs to the glycosyl hydrolase 18 [Homalodisca vitripennis]|nr:Belongs to the glycosyl hydrolase 18 [Homalodisca vitripennis]
MRFVASLCVLVLSMVVHATNSEQDIAQGLEHGQEAEHENQQWKVVCYFTQWSKWRQGDGKYTPDNIDPHLCTHIIFAFAKIENYNLVPFESSDLQVYKQLTRFKKINPNLKILIAVGGYNAGSAPFKQISSLYSARKKFVFNVIRFLRHHGFDGFDVDWEYPSGNDDKKNLVFLMKDLRETFEAERAHSRLLLTAAVAVGTEKVEAGYDIPALSRFVDFFNLMTYDFHGFWDHQTGHNAPLYALSSDSEYFKTLTVLYAVTMWANKGAPTNKLVVGIPSYGRSYTLVNPANSSIGAPASAGRPGEYTEEAGVLAYYEVCQMLGSGARYIWNDEMKAPYAVKDNQWVGFDDERSVREKVNFIKRLGCAGAMMWSLDMDDFTGKMCSKGRNPLLTAIKTTLRGNTTNEGDEPDFTTPDAATTSSPETWSTTTTFSKPPSESCDHGAYYPHETDCRQFYHCSHGTKVLKICGPGSAFNPDYNVCDWPQNVAKCKEDNKENTLSVTCEHGNYIPHETDCRKFYLCSHGTKHVQSCGYGTVFNPSLLACDWPQNVQSCQH